MCCVNEVDRLIRGERILVEPQALDEEFLKGVPRDCWPIVTPLPGGTLRHEYMHGTPEWVSEAVPKAGHSLCFALGQAGLILSTLGQPSMVNLVELLNDSWWVGVMVRKLSV